MSSSSNLSLHLRAMAYPKFKAIGDVYLPETVFKAVFSVFFYTTSVAPVIVSLPSRPSQASLNSQDPSSLASDTQVSASQSQSISSTPGSLSPIQHQASLDVIPVALQVSDVSSSSVSTVDSSVSLFPINDHPMITRAKSGIVQNKEFPDYQGYFTCLHAILELDEPSSFKVASFSSEWRQAMKEEIDALHMQGTWILVPSPGDKNIIGSKWVYKIKRNPDGSVGRYKARLVVQGFNQEPGFDFGETFSPVVRHTTVRLAPRAWNAKFTGSSDQLIQRVVTDLSEISYNSSGDIFVSQTKYAKDLLHKAGMSSCRACATPCKPHTQVLQTDGEPLADPTMFRSLVGALQYLTFTRPDLAYAVNHVCQYMNNPTEVHYFLVKRILRYVQGTLEYGISFTKGPWQLNAYSDADWAGDINTRRSTTGCVVFLGCNPISWQSKKQGSVSRSSTEAEYRALANTAADLSWIRQVLLDLKMFLPDAPTMYCDNLSALALSLNPVYHSRIKHLDIDFHFVRDKGWASGPENQNTELNR
ncbi:transposable element gene [Prunus dulcis]|uniref:Transposable element protein n=1 Tax=Prunus dulcis TaxID=3755 RepID=A0A5H2XME2_PRUDU|nr:transposable element gene [Prunus dulcis]